MEMVFITRNKWTTISISDDMDESLKRFKKKLARLHDKKIVKRRRNGRQKKE